MADYSSNTNRDLPTVKPRDWTKHEPYNLALRVENTFLSLNQGNFDKFCVAVSFTLVDLKFLVHQSLTL